MFFAVYFVIWFEETAIGKLLYDAEQVQVTWYRERIRKENQESMKYLQNPFLLWFLLTSVSIIYQYLVFDTMGDTSDDLILPMIFGLVIVLLPTILLIIHVLSSYWHVSKISKKEITTKTSETEIDHVSANNLNDNDNNNNNNNNNVGQESISEVSSFPSLSIARDSGDIPNQYSLFKKSTLRRVSILSRVRTSVSFVERSTSVEMINSKS
jgi:hypothetical protein